MTLVGTPSFFAPEVKLDFENMKPVSRYSPKADSWSFGLVFLTCLLGNLPTTKNIRELIESLADPLFKKILTGLLQEKPSDRAYLHDVVKKYCTDGAMVFSWSKMNIALINETQEFPLLHVASCEGKEILVWLLESFPYQWHLDLTSKSRGLTVLHIASELGHVDVFEYLHQNHNQARSEVDFWRRDINGFDVLVFAARFSRIQILQWMLKNFPKSLVIAHGFTQVTSTLLHWASYGGHLDIIKFLILELGEDNCQISKLDNVGRNMLHCAAFEGSVDVFKFFFENYGSLFDINACDSFGTVLHVAIGHPYANEDLRPENNNTPERLELVSYICDQIKSLDFFEIKSKFAGEVTALEHAESYNLTDVANVIRKRMQEIQ